MRYSETRARIGSRNNAFMTFDFSRRAERVHEFELVNRERIQAAHLNKIHRYAIAATGGFGITKTNKGKRNK
jgi:hypothetical protein